MAIDLNNQENGFIFAPAYAEHFVRCFGGLRSATITDLVAQLVEHLPFKERVPGSSPGQVTKILRSRSILLDFLV